MPSRPCATRSATTRPIPRCILTALADRFPEAVILLVGKLAQDGRTTSRVGRDELDRLVAGQVSYEDALAGYLPQLYRACGGDPAKVFSFDHLQARYLRR